MRASQELGLRGAGENAPIDVDRGAPGDDVHLATAGENGGRRGVREHRAERSLLVGVAHQVVEDERGDLGRGEPAEHIALRPRDLGRDLVDERADHRRGVHREALLRQAADGAREPVHGALRIGHRAVARRSVERRAYPADPLLGDLDRIERAPEEVHREGADLAEHVLGLHLVGMLAGEKEAPLRARGLLVGHGREDEIALQLRLLAREQGDDARAHRRHVLHVDGAASPEPPVVDLARERRVGPARLVGFDDVEVRVQEQRASRRAVVARRARPQARDEVRAPARLLEEARLDAGLAEKLGYPFRGGALVTVAGLVRPAVHGGDAQQILE